MGKIIGKIFKKAVGAILAKIFGMKKCLLNHHSPPRAVIEYQNVTAHGKVCKVGKSTFGSIASVMAETSCSVNATVLSHLLRIGSDKVERYPAPESELPTMLSQGGDSIAFLLQNFFSQNCP